MYDWLYSWLLTVADSLQLCLVQEIPKFQGCKETIEFIRAFKPLFDIMDSRDLYSCGCKGPLQTADNSVEILFSPIPILQYELT